MTGFLAADYLWEGSVSLTSAKDVFIDSYNMKVRSCKLEKTDRRNFNQYLDD